MMNYEKAQQYLNQAISIAKSNNQNIAVAITDDHGELLSFARMTNTSLHAGVLAQNKAYTAARDKQPTASLAAWAKETGKDMGYWSDSRFTGIQGGLPIEENGVIIGAIGVSGLSEEDDAALAQQAIATD
jgi:glc operon protein GlcG